TVRLPTWAVSASPWWAWALVALGAALTIVFGATAWAAAQERATDEQTLRTLPTWEMLGEGPSVRQAALRSQAPAGVVDRYLASADPMNHALVDTGFGLTTLLLGISILVHWPL